VPAIAVPTIAVATTVQIASPEARVASTPRAVASQSSLLRSA